MQLPGTPSTAAVASAGLGAQPLRVEGRIDTATWSAGNVPFAQVGGYGVRQIGALLFFDGPDSTLEGTGNCDIPMGSAPSDVTWRVIRDVVGLKLTGELYNTQTGVKLGACIFTITGLASSATIQAAGISVGGTFTGRVAFLRWFNSVVAPGTAIPIAIASPATLGDWEFDNSTADTSGLAQTLSGAQTYFTTPAYAPSCSGGVQQVFKLGTSGTLTGSGVPLDGGTTLTYAWVYQVGADGVNQAATITSPTSATTAVGHLNTFGSANFQLTCTDGSAQSTSSVVHDGVVPYDANGVVNESTAGLTTAQQKFVGPLIAYGQNPWSFADAAMVAELNIQACNLGIAGYSTFCASQIYLPFWRTFDAGTVTLTAGSATVVGSGTAFNSIASPTGKFMMWRYVGTDGLTHYTELQIASVADDTHLNVNTTYPTAGNIAPLVWRDCTTPCAGLAYKIVDPNNNWFFNGAPGNYYDNVMLFYTAYWRTGWDTAWTGAQTIALDWLEIPFNDYFFNCGNNNLSQNGFLTCSVGDPGRAWSVTGIMLHEQQAGNSNLLPGLRQMWFKAKTLLAAIPAATPPGPTDLRDNAYWQEVVAGCVLIESDPTEKANCVTGLKNALTNSWTPFRRTAVVSGTTYHYWDNYYSQTINSGNPAFSSVTSIGGAGSVCVTNGSATITGTGTTWPSSLAPVVNGGYGVIWFFPTPATLPANNAAGDNQVYVISGWTSATSMTITPVYAGTTGCTGVSGSNKGFEIATTGGLVAWGFQPFMLGLLSQSFSNAADALTSTGDTTQAATFRTYADDAAQSVVGLGITSDNGGLFNGAQYPGCSPSITAASPTWAIDSCYGTGNGYASGAASPDQSRTLSQEVMRALSFDYLANQSAAVLAAGNKLMSQMYCPTGTCGGVASDGFYLDQYLLPNGFFVSGSGQIAKWAGQVCGFTGACAVWPAARVAPLLPGVPGSVSSGFIFGGILWR